MGVDFVAVQVMMGTVLREPCVRGRGDSEVDYLMRGPLWSIVSIFILLFVGLDRPNRPEEPGKPDFCYAP